MSLTRVDVTSSGSEGTPGSAKWCLNLYLVYGDCLLGRPSHLRLTVIVLGVRNSLVNA